jgi:hypothetical protein
MSYHLLLAALCLAGPPAASQTPPPWLGSHDPFTPCYWEDHTLDARAKLSFFNWRSIGRKEAEADLSRGTLKLKTFGLPSTWYPNYEKLLKDRLGVELERIAACVVAPSAVDYAAGYNRRVEAEIERRFGAGALERVADRAKSEPRRRGQVVGPFGR